jgi:peptide chain release factor
MILLQLSAAQGPVECALAVAKAVKRLQVEAKTMSVEVSVIEHQDGDKKGTFKSVLLSLNGAKADLLASQWTGSMQWTHPSPYRPTHKRKNWFFGGSMTVHLLDERSLLTWRHGCQQDNTIGILSQNTGQNEIQFQFCRASGAGGQHVNKTDSAVRATHVQTGVCVRVETERSQHANKRLAVILINKKLDELADEQSASQTADRRMHHHSIERGNVMRTFKGDDFKPA